MLGSGQAVLNRCGQTSSDTPRTNRVGLVVVRSSPSPNYLGPRHGRTAVVSTAMDRRRSRRERPLCKDLGPRRSLNTPSKVKCRVNKYLPTVRSCGESLYGRVAYEVGVTFTM